MDNKVNKGVISRLSDLISDTRVIPQAHSTHVSPQPLAPRNTVFTPLELTKWPTLLGPWSSLEDGEIWVLGDGLLTFLKKPKAGPDPTMEMQRKWAAYQDMIDHCDLYVFYRIYKNSQGPSYWQDMTITFELVDRAMLARLLDGKAGNLLQAEGGGQMGPLMVGLFVGEMRLKLSEYEDFIRPHTVKRRFFELLCRPLAVSGQPKLIGDLLQAYGHPEKGLPVKRNNSGCALMILLCIGIGDLGTDVYVKVLGIQFTCEKDRDEAHGWR